MLSVLERQLLSHARAILDASLHPKYLCTALGEAANVVLIQDTQSQIYTQIATANRKLMGYISYSLDGHRTLEDWQRANGHNVSGRFTREFNLNRMNWVDWMLGKFDEREKTRHS